MNTLTHSPWPKPGDSKVRAVRPGAAGTGKSLCAAFTATTYMVANFHKTLMFIFDPIKSAQEFNHLNFLPNVYSIIPSYQVGPAKRLYQLINLIFLCE